MAKGYSQNLPEQYEQPVTASATADSDSNSTRFSEPGVEPEDTGSGDCQWSETLEWQHWKITDYFELMR